MTVPKEYQQHIHKLEQEFKLNQDTIETLREALEDAEDRISGKEMELQGSQQAALQLFDRNKKVWYSTNSCIKLIYLFLIAQKASSHHWRKLH